MDFSEQMILVEKTPSDANRWQALQLFNLFRLAMAICLLTIGKFNYEINFFALSNELIYQKISTTYLIISVVCLLSCLINKTFYFWQANLPIFADIIFIILLMHVSGGIVSGVGLLLIVIVAAHSLLVPGRLSLFSAAVATLGVIFELFYSYLDQVISINAFTQGGLLGLVIFATALITNWLYVRIRKGEVLVEEQAQQLITSQQLNSQIIFAMDEGILVLDKHHKIRLVNTAARRLLGVRDDEKITYLRDLPPKLQQAYLDWQQLGKSQNTLAMSDHSAEVRLNFHRLGRTLPISSLIFIYDTQEETRHAQDLKLASLGHLTAQIAHEIRNPLGAISHAAQLLAESPGLTSQDMSLIQMINQHCVRMNIVIQNVLSLSARGPSKSEVFDLIAWLKQFVHELSIPSIPDPQIHLHSDISAIQIRVDPTQLTQILINLCENGLRYSLRHQGHATLNLRVGMSEKSGITIDIIDNGPGIPVEIAKHIFEPFFSTEKTGSGLGLYIAKELCQMNGARLDYISPSQPNQGSQFRLTISQGDLH